MNWNAEFGGLPPVKLPGGGTLETLADCRALILTLPAKEQAATYWQAATKTLLRASQPGGPYCFIARIAVSRAHGALWALTLRQNRATRERPGRPNERAGSDHDRCSGGRPPTEVAETRRMQIIVALVFVIALLLVVRVVRRKRLALLFLFGVPVLTFGWHLCVRQWLLRWQGCHTSLSHHPCRACRLHHRHNGQ